MFTSETLNYSAEVDIVMSENCIEGICSQVLVTDWPVVDASGGTLVPGLFEAHAHMGDHYFNEAQEGA